MYRLVKRAFSGLNIFKYFRFNRLGDRYGIVFVTALFYSVASAAPPNQIQNQCPLKDPRGQRVWDLIVETTSTNPNPVGVLKNIPSSDTCSNPDLPDIGVFHTPMLKLLNQPSESTQQVSLAQFTWLESMKDFVHSKVFLAQRFPYLFKNKKPTPVSIVKNLCGLNPNHCENSGIKNAQAILLESAKALARDLEKSKTKPLTLEDTKNYLNNSLHNLYLFHTPVRALEYELESKGESQNTEINPVEATSTRNTFDDPRNHPALKSKNNHDKKSVENLHKLKEETQAQYESIASLIESDPNLMLMRTKTLKRYFKPGIKMPKITGIAEVPVEPSKVSDENEILKAGQEYLDNLQTSVSELHKGLASVKLQKKYGEPETHGRSSALWLSHMIRYNPIAAARAIKQNPSLSPELCKRLQGIEKWEEFEKDLLELSEHAMTASVILSAGITAPEVILSRGLANTVARKFALDEAKVALRYQLAKSLNSKLGHAVFTATIGQHVGNEFKLLEELDQTKRALLLNRGVSRDDLTSTKQQLNQNHEALMWDVAFLAVPKVFRHTPAGKIFKNIPTAQKVADLIKWKHLQPRRIQALFEEFTLACGYFDARCGVAMSAFHAASAKERLQKLKDFENSRDAKSQNNQPPIDLEMIGYDKEGVPRYGKIEPIYNLPAQRPLSEGAPVKTKPPVEIESKKAWLARIESNKRMKEAFTNFMNHDKIKLLDPPTREALIDKLYHVHSLPLGYQTNKGILELSNHLSKNLKINPMQAKQLAVSLGDAWVLGPEEKPITVRQIEGKKILEVHFGDYGGITRVLSMPMSITPRVYMEKKFLSAPESLKALRTDDLTRKKNELESDDWQKKEGVPGVLYHGMGNPAAAPSIQEHGFYLSVSETYNKEGRHIGHTKAQMGTGLYSTVNRSLAQGRTEADNALYFPLIISTSAIVVTGLPPEIYNEAEQLNRDPHLYARDQYGVQVIIKDKNTTLILDEAALVSSPTAPDRYAQTVIEHVVDPILYARYWGKTNHRAAYPTAPPIEMFEYLFFKEKTKTLLTELINIFRLEGRLSSDNFSKRLLDIEARKKDFVELNDYHAKMIAGGAYTLDRFDFTRLLDASIESGLSYQRVFNMLTAENALPDILKSRAGRKMIEAIAYSKYFGRMVESSRDSDASNKKLLREAILHKLGNSNNIKFHINYLKNRIGISVSKDEEHELKALNSILGEIPN